MLPGKRADSPQASFASFTPRGIDSPALAEIINSAWRHEIWIRTAGGVGPRAGVRLDAFSCPSARSDPGILLGWDLINHQQRHMKHTGICPTACSVISLKARREVHPRDIQGMTLLLSGKDAHKKLKRRTEKGREKETERANVLKMLKFGNSGTDIQVLLR